MTRQLLWRGLAEPDPMTSHRAESVGLASRSRAEDAREGVESLLGQRPAVLPQRVSDDYLEMFGD
jgi:hypothetical protein